MVRQFAGKEWPWGSWSAKSTKPRLPPALREDKAKAAAEAIPAAEQLTTKADLAKLEGSLSLLATKESVAKLETRVARLEWAAYAVVALLVKIAFFN